MKLTLKIKNLPEEMEINNSILKIQVLWKSKDIMIKKIIIIRF